MCNRFTYEQASDKLKSAFGKDVLIPEKLRKQYNICPTDDILAFRMDDDGMVKGFDCQWGIRLPGKQNPITNARSETASEKPIFRDSWIHRRCLVPADGFYEWKSEGRSKIPHLLSPSSGEGPWLFAGLWVPCGENASATSSCVILTMEPNAEVARYHNRMPLIIPKSRSGDWLGSPPGQEKLLALGRQCHAQGIEAHRVDGAYLKPGLDDERARLPFVERVEQLPLFSPGSSKGAF